MDRTNETATGYTYGGQKYQKQTKTDSQGNTYTVDIPVSNSIPVSTVTAQTTPMTVPQPQAPINYNQITTGATSPYLEAAQMQQQQLSNQLSSDANSIQNLMSSLSGKSAYEAQQAQDLGLNKANQDYITKSAELSALNKQAAAAQQENIAQGRQLGSVASFVAGQGNEIERNRAIRALTIGAELDALQGNIQVAQMKVKQAVDAKYAAQETDLANRLKMFEVNKGVYDTLSTQEQKQWERAKYQTEQAQKQLDEKKKTEEDIGKMLMDARAVNTPEAKAAADAAQKVFDKGGSKLAVAQALGVYGGDYLKNELLKEQIKSQKADQAKTYQDIAKSKAEMAQNTTQDGNYLDPKVTENPTFKLAQQLTPVKTAIQAYKNAIEKYGSYELANATGKGEIQATYGNAIAAWKTMAGLGALSGADFNLAENAIPEPALFTRNSTSISKLDNSLANAQSQVDTYVKTLKTAYPKSAAGIDSVIGTTAQFIIPQGVSSASASYAQSTMGSLNNVNSQLNTQQSYGGYDTGIK